LYKQRVLINELPIRVCLLEMGTPAAKRPVTPEEERQALEDAEDIAASRAALEEMQRTGAQPRPWREVYAELGLDPHDLRPDDDE
jgi:hypothetical protein